jgi:hypothetical protein
MAFDNWGNVIENFKKMGFLYAEAAFLLVGPGFRWQSTFPCLHWYQKMQSMHMLAREMVLRMPLFTYSLFTCFTEPVFGLT